MHGTRSSRPTAVFKTSLLALLIVVFAHSVFASGAGEHSALRAPPAGANSLKPIVHVSSAAPDFRPEPPIGVRIPERYLDYDNSPETSSARFIDDEPSKVMHFARIAGKSLVAATTTCDTNAFANASTSTIGELVRTSDLSCINALFNLTGTTAASVFSESKMIAVANYAKPYAVSYPGDKSTGVEQFATFLRAGYYVQFYNSTAVPAYSSNVTTAVDAYLDAFVANSHLYDVNDNHGEVLHEVLTLTASSVQQARYAGTYKNLLDRYNSSYNAFYYMKASIDEVFSAFFHAAWVPAWVSLVNSDTSVVTTLNNFVTRTSFNANAPDEWLTRDAAAELAHFLDGGTYASNVVNVAKPLVRTVIQTYNFTNNGVSIFIAAVAGQDYYDGTNCSYYGTCSTKSQVMAAVQGQSYQCPGDAIKVVAQNMTTQQFSDTCATLHNEVAYIHGLFKDPGAVAGDNTAGLEVDVFNTSADYATYGSYLYGINTNNGGLSIEGDPSQVGNVAHFYCYHAEWITADWEIWNLWHEFTHYMDAKYNQKGAFADAPTSNANLPYSEVWWIEGIAEYVSYSYRNLVDSGAVTVAGNHTYSLPRLFNNTYDMASYQEAAYPGGYLAVNFMINNHRADVDTMLGIFRAGGYSTSYHTFLDGIRNSYTSEFESFQTCFKNNNGTGGCGNTDTIAPTVSISAPASGATVSGSVSISGSASDNVGVTKVEVYADGALKSTSTGSGLTSFSATWDSTSVANGTHSITAKAYDAAGNVGTSTSRSVTVSNSIPDTTPPSTSISAPATGSTLSGTVTVSATASDNVGVTKIEFYIDSALKTSVNASSLGYSWDTTTATNGSHTLSTKAYDAAGNVGSSSNVTVAVANSTSNNECTGPAGTLGNGCTRSNLSVAANQQLNFTLAVPAGSSNLVFAISGGTGDADIYIKAGSAPTLTSYDYRPYLTGNNETVTIAAPTNTTYYVMINAYAAFSAVTLKASYTAPSDTTPPTTSITAPAAGATVSGTTTVTATASDNVGVTKIELFIDGALTTSVNASSLNYSWNTATATNGAHTLTTKAYDAVGNVGTSAARLVTVSNSSTPTECTGPAGSLDSGCTRSNLSAATGAEIYYYLWVPTGATTLTFSMSGGTGDADLYVKSGAWPTTTAWDYRPYISGNNESVTIAPPNTGGYYYVMINAYQAFSGVTLKATYQ